MKSFRKSHVVRNARRGIAPLELVMLLPFMVALLVLLFYVGHAGSDQLELAQNTHYNAWRVRYDDQPDDIKPLSYVEIEQGQIEDEEEGKVESGLIYDKWNHETKSEAQFYANPWNKNSKWEDENKWPAAFVHGSKDKEVLENNNQRIFYFQRNGQTYWSNLPYYEKTPATPVRNSDYVDPNTGDGIPTNPPDDVEDYDEDDYDEEDLEEEEDEEEEEPCGIEALRKKVDELPKKDAEELKELLELREKARKEGKFERYIDNETQEDKNNDKDKDKIKDFVNLSGKNVHVEILNLDPSDAASISAISTANAYVSRYSWIDCNTGYEVYTIVSFLPRKNRLQEIIYKTTIYDHELFTHVADRVAGKMKTLEEVLDSEKRAYYNQAAGYMRDLDQLRNNNKDKSFKDWPSGDRELFTSIAIECYESYRRSYFWGIKWNIKDYKEIYDRINKTIETDTSVRREFRSKDGVEFLDKWWKFPNRIPYLEITKDGITHRYVYPEQEFLDEVENRGERHPVNPLFPSIPTIDPFRPNIPSA